MAQSRTSIPRATAAVSTLRTMFNQRSYKAALTGGVKELRNRAPFYVFDIEMEDSSQEIFKGEEVHSNAEANQHSYRRRSSAKRIRDSSAKEKEVKTRRKQKNTREHTHLSKLLQADRRVAKAAAREFENAIKRQLQEAVERLERSFLREIEKLSHLMEERTKKEQAPAREIISDGYKSPATTTTVPSTPAEKSEDRASRHKQKSTEAPAPRSATRKTHQKELKPAKETVYEWLYRDRRAAQAAKDQWLAKQKATLDMIKQQQQGIEQSKPPAQQTLQSSQQTRQSLHPAPQTTQSQQGAVPMEVDASRARVMLAHASWNMPDAFYRRAMVAAQQAYKSFNHNNNNNRRRNK